jgi:copper chaperone CopZ
MASIDLKTGGMHCASCSMLIEMTVGDLPGVTAAKSDYVSGATHVEYDPAQVSVEDIVNAIVEAGYTAEPAA